MPFVDIGFVQNVKSLGNMEDIQDVLKTAHITLETATLRVVVDDISLYKDLYEEKGNFTKYHTDGIPIFETSELWKESLKFPDYVIYVSPSRDKNCLLIHVCDGYDFLELSNWLDWVSSK